MVDAKLAACFGSVEEGQKDIESALLAEVSLVNPKFPVIFNRYRKEMLKAHELGYSRNAIRQAMINLGFFPKISRARFYAIWRKLMPKDSDS